MHEVWNHVAEVSGQWNGQGPQFLLSEHKEGQAYARVITQAMDVFIAVEKA